MNNKQLALIAIGAALSASACAPNYSEGTRTGIVTKISRKGLLFKSWEGELLIGNNFAIHEKFTFNVDPEAVEKVKQAAATGKPVELVYHEWYSRPLTIESDYVVTDVKGL